MPAPVHILRWMAEHLEARDPAAIAQDLVALLVTDPGVTDVRVFVSGRQVAATPGEPPPDDAVAEVEEGVARVLIGGAPSEETRLGASAGALCLQRASRADPRRQLIHDLRGALAVISGHSEMLDGGVWGPLTPEQVRSIKAMARQADRMRDLLDRLREV